MIKPALLLLLLVACGNSESNGVRFVHGLADRSPRLACKDALTANRGEAVAELKSLTGAKLLAIFPDARRIDILDSDLNAASTLVFDTDGPWGVRIPTSAALIDSVLFVVDRQKPLLRRFTLSGRVLPDVHLNFVPLTIAAVGRRLAITPAVFGRSPGQLLYQLREGQAVSLGIAPWDAANVSVKLIGNMVSMAVLDGKLFIAHQFLTPRAYLWQPDSRPHRVRLPLPEGVRAAVGYVPPLPLDEAAMKPVLVGALAATADPVRKHFLFLTRSGSMLGAHFEKLLIRTDPELNLVDAFRLPVNAGHVALLPERDQVVVIDEEGSWFTCRLP